MTNEPKDEVEEIMAWIGTFSCRLGGLMKKIKVLAKALRAEREKSERLVQSFDFTERYYKDRLNRQAEEIERLKIDNSALEDLMPKEG